MINIDVVYQRVLALANKEQRGYITPQEFNLFANHAQLEIIEQYFYDKNQFGRIEGNDTDYSDMLSLIEEKIGHLTTTVSISAPVISGSFPIASNMLHVGGVFKSGGRPIQQVQSRREFIQLQVSGDLIKPDSLNPIYYIGDFGGTGTPTINVFPDPNAPISVEFVRKPTKAVWGYVVVNDKALYDPSNSINFELHPMEETELVHKILKLSGISIKAQDVTAAGQGLENAKVQQEKQ